jgi:expansin (peptidoglycan-binding protein)
MWWFGIDIKIKRFAILNMEYTYDLMLIIQIAKINLNFAEPFQQIPSKTRVL